MWTILAAVVGLILAGGVIVIAIALTMKWLKAKIRELLKPKNAKKVFAADIRELADNCDNRISLDDLEKLTDEGYTHFVAAIDDNNEIMGKVEMIKDKSDIKDAEVRRLLGEKGMVVVEK